MKKKVLFVCASLHRGGTERVLINLMSSRSFKSSDYECYLLCNIEGVYYKIDDQIKENYACLNGKTFHRSLIKMAKYINRFDADLVFFFCYDAALFFNFLSLTCSLKKQRQTKYVVRLQSILSQRRCGKYKKYIYRHLCRSMVKRFDMVVCQSRYMLQDMEKYTELTKKVENICVLNNPVNDILFTINGKKDPSKTLRLLFVGQLVPFKRLDLLLRCLSSVKRDWHLDIVGSGHCEQVYVDLAHKLGISDSITWVGSVSNPENYYNKSDALLVTSRSEGFPGVVLEAGACGLPVIAMNSKGSTAESFAQTPDMLGVLVEDSAECLIDAIENFNSAGYKRSEIRENVLERHGMEESAAKYIELFDDLLLCNN